VAAVTGGGECAGMWRVSEGAYACVGAGHGTTCDGAWPKRKRVWAKRERVWAKRERVWAKRERERVWAKRERVWT
jgi:hypothetical protein